VINKKLAAGFKPSENIHDLKIQWNDSEEFWCLEFTLKLLSKKEISKKEN